MSEKVLDMILISLPKETKLSQTCLLIQAWPSWCNLTRLIILREVQQCYFLHRNLLMSLPYVSVLPKPLVMELVLAGQAKSLDPLNVTGIYSLQEKLVNSYPHWNQQDGENSIWLGKEFDYNIWDNLGNFQSRHKDDGSLVQENFLEEWMDTSLALKA